MGRELVLKETGELVEIPQWLDGIDVDVSADEMAEVIGERITAAESLDAMLEELPASVPLENITGQDITVHGFRLALSAVNKREHVYAIMDVELHDTAERIVVTCGATGVLRQLAKAWGENWLPMKCKPYGIGSKSNPGQTALRLGKAGSF